MNTHGLKVPEHSPEVLAAIDRIKAALPQERWGDERETITVSVADLDCLLQGLWEVRQFNDWALHELKVRFPG